MYVWIKVRSDTLNTIATVIGGLAALVTTLGHRLHAQDLFFAQGFPDPVPSHRPLQGRGLRALQAHRRQQRTSFQERGTN